MFRNTGAVGVLGGDEQTLRSGNDGLRLLC